MSTNHRILLLILIITPLSSSFSQYIIKGTACGSDGKPMIRADIFLLSNEARFPRPVLQSYTVSADGSFTINCSTPGIHRLRFTGVNHREYEIPFYLDTPGKAVIDVRLAAIQYKEKINEVGFRIDFDPVSYTYRDKRDIKANNEGLFLATFTAADSLFTYYLANIDKDGHTVNGLQADYFLPDGSDYMAVLRAAPDSSVTLTFDPSDVIRSFEPASYTIIRAPEKTQKFSLIHSDYAERYQRYHDYVIEGRKRGIYDNDYANNYGWKRDFKELDKLIKTETDPFLRQGWYISRLKIALSDAWAKPRAKISKKLAENALKEIPPDSPLWSFHPNTMTVALGYASDIDKSFQETQKKYYFMKNYGKPFMTYINKAVASHPDSSIYHYLLASAIANAYKYKEFELFDAYYKEFMERYSGTPHAERIEKCYSPARKIKPGNQVPDFTFESIDAPGEKMTPETLRGKNYIINFWATWCGPCKATIEALTGIYEEYQGPEFEIISASICFRKDHAIQFRKEKLPMPWFNTHIDNWKPRQGILYDFEVVAIPKVILVDKKGIIQEVNDLEHIIELLQHM